MSDKWKCIACGKDNYSENLRCASCGVPSEALSSTKSNDAYQKRIEAVALDKYHCVKCKSQDFEVGELMASGGGISSFFNLNNKRFYHLSCNDCGYTEFYRGSVSTKQKLFDLLGN